VRSTWLHLVLSFFLVTAAAANGLSLKNLRVEDQVIRGELAVQFSDAALEALDASVPLSFLQSLRTTEGTVEQLITMSYAPLYERFELVRGDKRSYFRLRAELLDAFSQIEPITFKGQALQFRVALLIERLPAPMRIPALFSSDWDLDTGLVTPPQANPP
jgi:Domain of unknown function (DUF4390)